MGRIWGIDPSIAQTNNIFTSLLWVSNSTVEEIFFKSKILSILNFDPLLGKTVTTERFWLGGNYYRYIPYRGYLGGCMCVCGGGGVSPFCYIVPRFDSD